MRVRRRTSSRQPRSPAAVSLFSTSGLGRCRETSRSSTSSHGWARWSTRRPTRSPCGGRRWRASSPTCPTSPTRRRHWPWSRRSPRPRRRSRGIGFIRSKESDRIAAVVSELQRCGVDAVEQPDGFVVHPGAPHGATIETYGDHRMAMSFALLGLVTPGIEIETPSAWRRRSPPTSSRSRSSVPRAGRVTARCA